MSKLKKISFSIIIIIMITLKVDVNATTNNVEKLKEGKTYEVDLNQDGVKEKIKVKNYSYDEWDDDLKYAKVYVNDKVLFTTSDDNMGFGISINLVTCGEKKYINLVQSSFNDCMVMNKLLLFDGKKLKEIIDFDSYETTARTFDIISATKTSINVKCIAQPSQLGYLEWTSNYKVSGYKLTKKSNTHKVKVLIPKHKNSIYVANRKINFLSKIASKTVAFSVKAGDKVKLVSITTKGTKTYGRFKKGDKYGYLRVDNYFENMYFKNVLEYLAG